MPDEKRAESAECLGCGALSPRDGGATRFASRTTVFPGEGTPLPAPLPGDAPRRGVNMADCRHRLLGPPSEP